MIHINYINFRDYNDVSYTLGEELGFFTETYNASYFEHNVAIMYFFRLRSSF